MSKSAQEETSGPAGPFGCGWFIREFLLGLGPKGSPEIDPETGATQADINYAYKEALAKATARERAERIISRMVVRILDFYALS